METLIHLRILLPTGPFLDKKLVSRIIVETGQGAYGLLPNRLDCVAALVPSILTYESQKEGETFIAIDNGILIKTHQDVYIFVRNAIKGHELGKLTEAIKSEYIEVDDFEKEVRSVLAKLESGFLRQFQEILTDQH